MASWRTKSWVIKETDVVGRYVVPPHKACAHAHIREEVFFGGYHPVVEEPASVGRAFVHARDSRRAVVGDDAVHQGRARASAVERGAAGGDVPRRGV